MDNPVSKIATGALLILATARASRFFTSDFLGEWTISGPVHRWGQRHEVAALRAEWDQLTHPRPPFEHWARGDDGPVTWQAKLAKGLDCPFCVGFWLGGLILLGEATIGRSRLRPIWRFGLAVAGLNYLVGHISSRIDS